MAPNSEVKSAIDEAVFNLLGQDILESLYKHLSDHYDITPNEVPYRLDTLFDTLERTFGVRGARTISRAIAKRIYLKLNLRFIELPNNRLQDYIEQAKRLLVSQL
jgi:hypothetical protein